MGVFNFRDWVSSCPRCKELGSKEVNSVRHERITGTGGPEAKVQPRKSSPRRSYREAEATFLSMLRFQASTESIGEQHPGRKALGSVQCVEAGVAETAAEMALRPVASREWFVLLIVSVLVKVPPV